MPTVVFCQEARGTFSQGNNVFHFEVQDLFKKEIEHFLAAAEGIEAPRGNLDESLTMMRVIDSLRKSHERGGSEWITL